MTLAYKYVALHVPDLRAAETLYRHVLGLELLFRESQSDDGTWHALRPELDWEDARSQGIEVGMVALGRDGFVLALFRGLPAPGTIYEICVGVATEEIEQIGARAQERALVQESNRTFLRFRDPFGFQWAVQPLDARFRSSGDIAGRWLPPV
jgi:catechol 2,3-dioxygenase-like lactoylglutathione lyase family enzyme